MATPAPRSACSPCAAALALLLGGSAPAQATRPAAGLGAVHQHLLDLVGDFEGRWEGRLPAGSAPPVITRRGTLLGAGRAVVVVETFRSARERRESVLLITLAPGGSGAFLAAFDPATGMRTMRGAWDPGREAMVWRPEEEALKDTSWVEEEILAGGAVRSRAMRRRGAQAMATSATLFVRRVPTATQAAAGAEEESTARNTRGLAPGLFAGHWLGGHGDPRHGGWEVEAGSCLGGEALWFVLRSTGTERVLETVGLMGRMKGSTTLRILIVPEDLEGAVPRQVVTRMLGDAHVLTITAVVPGASPRPLVPCIWTLDDDTWIWAWPGHGKPAWAPEAETELVLRRRR